MIRLASLGISTKGIFEYIKSNRSYVKAFFIYLIIALIMFWQVTVQFFTATVNGGGDVYQTLFNLWWVPYSLFTLHTTPYFTHLLYYPVGANLVTQTLTPLTGIVSAPLQALGSVFNYNVLFFLSFALSGICMFALADYVTKNKYAAFIAGLIFAFSPIHVTQAYGHLDWTIVEFIPLFVLFFILTIREKRLIYSFLAALSFVLLTFAGDIEQGIIATFLAIILLIIFAIYERKDVLTTKTYVNIGLMIIFVLILGSPFFIFLLPKLTSTAFSAATQLSGTLENMYWSDNLLSFFLPGYYNGLFHGAALAYSNQIYGFSYQGATFAPDFAEKTSYVGYTVLALVLIALYNDFKHHKLKNTALWLILLVVFVLLALGPYIQISTLVTPIPTLYTLYSHIPLFNIVREPGRFDFIVTICLGILAAIGFVHLANNKDNKKAFNYMVIISLLILIEYNGTPLTPSFANSTIMHPTIPQIYTTLSNQSEYKLNFTALVLPTLPNGSNIAPALYPGMATYYVTALKRPIIGGYTSRTNATQQLSEQIIPLVSSASYLESGQGLIYQSPIQENYSNVTRFWLNAYHIGIVSIIRQAYSSNDLNTLYSYTASLLGQPIFIDNSTITFENAALPGSITTGQLSNSIISYPTQTWIPGYYFCQSSLNCNFTFSTLWWGSNERGIGIYSPFANGRRVQLSFQAGAYQPGPQLQLYFNSASTPYATLNVTPSVLRQFTFNLTLSSGFNEVIFYMQNSTQNPYLNYGIRNITIT